MSDDEGAERPTLTVVHGGEPGSEELAALVVALSSRTAAAPPSTRTRSRWADREGLLRRPLEPGRGRWAATGRPVR